MSNQLKVGLIVQFSLRTAHNPTSSVTWCVCGSLIIDGPPIDISLRLIYSLQKCATSVCAVISTNFVNCACYDFADHDIYLTFELKKRGRNSAKSRNNQRYPVGKAKMIGWNGNKTQYKC